MSTSTSESLAKIDLPSGAAFFTKTRANASPIEDPLKAGRFFRLTSETPGAKLEFSLGLLCGVTRLVGCHRYEPFWMKPFVGKTGADIRVETQYLLAETERSTFVLAVPLMDSAFRASLEGTETGEVKLIAESGDPAVVTDSIAGLFLAEGNDPFALMESGAKSVCAFLKTGRLRREKSLPDFVDVFGWCTWDSFYQEVSLEKVKGGLESFRQGGIQPKLLILDDGWQSVRKMPTGETRLTSFKANEKFPGGLAPTVQMAKGEYGVESLLVWHALLGYWGGTDGDSLSAYGIRSLSRQFSPGILHHEPRFNTEYWGNLVGVIPPQSVYQFYQDYHRQLRHQGVDGVKVDNQCMLESVSYSFGGRVAMMRAYHEALEGSIQTQFNGALINCMSCASEVFYSALNSNLIRTSTDFWPNRPASHGLHLYTNALVGLWFSEFLLPDWDMFQSGHLMGAYHAAGRAVSGGPVYVSDKPDAHNFDLLRKLVLEDGTTLRAREAGRPTRDCLFTDPLNEAAFLKVFNLNLDAGILGVFNARYSEENPTDPITGTISPADIEGLSGEQFAVYAHESQILTRMSQTETLSLTLPQLSFELFTLVPIRDGVAPLGLTDKYNSAGVVTRKGIIVRGIYEIELRAGGEFAALVEARPLRVKVNGAETEFTYNDTNSLLRLSLDPKTSALIQLYLSEG